MKEVLLFVTSSENKLNRWFDSKVLSRNRLVLYALLTFYLISLLVTKIILSDNRLITGDARYYYAQVRSPLMDGDLDFKNDLEMYNPLGKPIDKERIDKNTGKLSIKYPIGSALLWSPFVCIAHGLCICLDILGFEVDTTGYGFIYLLFLGLGSILYFLISVILASKMINRWFSIDNADWLLVPILLCTSTIYYVAMEPAMSHTCSLFTVSLYLYAVFKSFGQRKTNWDILFIGISAALMIMVRNQNGLFLLFSLIEFIYCIRKGKLSLWPYILMALATLLSFVPQMLYWKDIYGGYLVYSYGTESFKYLFQPKFYSVLFSRVSGLIYWHPINALSIIGLIYLASKRQVIGGLLLVFFLLQLYINSSWGCWWLGAAFGNRGLINCSIILATGLIYWMLKNSHRLKTMHLIPVFLVLFALNNIMIYQFSQGSIPHETGMYYRDLIPFTFF